LVLGVELRASHLLGSCSTTLAAIFGFGYFWVQVLLYACAVRDCDPPICRCLAIGGDGVLRTFCPDWLQTDLTSRVARNTGLRHCACKCFIYLFVYFWWYWGLNSGALPLEPYLQSIFLWLFWRWGLQNYLLGLALNLTPPDFSLPNS
jgi:hypothetical protein